MNNSILKSIFYVFSLVIVFCNLTIAQQKLLTENEYKTWNNIRNVQLSPNGDWTLYNLQPNKGDATLILHNNISDKDIRYERAKSAHIDYDGQWLFFIKTCDEDTLTQLKKRKVKSKDFPKDTLVIVNLKTNITTQIPNVLSYKKPEKYGQNLCYLLEPETWEKSDSTKADIKKENKENGSKLVIYNLKLDKTDTLYYVDQYMFAEKAPIVLVHSTGMGDSLQSIIRYDMISMKKDSIYTKKGKYSQLTINNIGDKIAFIADFDTTKTQVRPHEIFYWQKNKGTTQIANEKSSFFMSDKKISEYSQPYFSEDNKRLFYGISPLPIVQDTSLLDEEIVDVEVWSTTDTKLFTQQKANLKEDRERSYLVSYDIAKNKHIPLNNSNIPFIKIGNRGNSRYAVASHTKSYEKESSWLGYMSKDVFKIDTETGESKKIIRNTEGYIQLSPLGRYAYWYSRPDTSWYAYDLSKDKLITICDGKNINIYDELFDQPNHPYSYGVGGWTNNDESLLIYDRYDIWECFMNGKKAKKWTNGRNQKIVNRYIRLDDELRYVPKDSSILIHIFDEKDKSSGYAKYSHHNDHYELLIQDKYAYDRQPSKARNANVLVTSKESFKIFPNLLLTNLSISNPQQISDANPQQYEYRWGDAELYTWKDFNGRKVEGLLIKPDGFDPNKKYPLMVNFYEKNSSNLYRHRAPDPHRSTINYSVYANKGYIIFNPDIAYTDGHPGQSCYDAVVSGVESLQKKGFIDHTRMGIQGHSWGGYQIAYLLNKTNIFKCAESGAPVVNMTSAYGGIRWRSGMSRMFQYEHTQSRIGATLWEKPELYIENSPLFELPNITTPVLILHNDKDGAVPWYQGIEYFVALRRLNKKAWLLNYNDEPHWPVKWQNRMDFQKRMSQFFDHYLLDQPMPAWMSNGMTAIEKGINQGLEFIDK